MRRPRFWLLTSIHTIFLVVVFFVLLRLPYTYDYESSAISWVSIVKNALLHLEDKPDSQDYLLVNVSYQKQLIPRYDEFDFEIGNEAITDRTKIAQFFVKAASVDYRFILCDVFLDREAPGDSLLMASVKGKRNVVFPYHYEEGHFIKPVIPVPSALSDYQSDFGNFTKYTFQQYDTCTTVALQMHEVLDGHSYDNHLLYANDNNAAVLNSLILNLPIRQYDIFRDDTLGYSSIHLQNLLSLPHPLFEEMLKGKIVVLGDFLESDMHNTLYGSMAGPLIHLNAYINLKEHRGHISAWFMLYIVACSFLISMFLFTDDIKTRFAWIERIESGKMGWLMDYLKYASFLLLISVTSYLIFGIFLNILLVSLYFSIVENVVEFIQNKTWLQWSTAN